MACEIDKFNMKPWNPPAPALALAGAVPRSQSVCPIAPYATPVLSWPVQLAQSCRREPVWLRRGLFGCDSIVLWLFSCDAVAVAKSDGLPLCDLSCRGMGTCLAATNLFFLLFSCDTAAVARSGGATAVCSGLPLCGLSGGLLGYDHSLIVLLLFNCDAAAMGRGGGLPLCSLSGRFFLCVRTVSFLSLFS